MPVLLGYLGLVRRIKDMKIIEVKNLTKKYKEHTAVDGITFEVEEGE